MSQFERAIDLLNRRHIVYRQLPVDDSESQKFDWGWYYEDGTYACYDLFRSKAKITTYKSLKWHLLVLWYLNPQLNPDDFDSRYDYLLYLGCFHQIHRRRFHAHYYYHQEYHLLL